MSPTIMAFTLQQACELYSILPQELDEMSLELLREDLDKTCKAIFGKQAFIVGGITNE